jgi:peptidoglycan DL-endopeptidase CwlO
LRWRWRWDALGRGDLGRARGQGIGGGAGGLSRGAVLALVTLAVVLVGGLIVAPMLIVGGSGLLFQAGSGCAAAQGQQPPASSGARDSIPANYLALFQETGKRYGVPWVILAGIGKVESDDGRSTLPGVNSGANAFGAAGPMQIGIGGAAGNQWGGAPVHPANERVNGVAVDVNNDGTASVYDPADAIAGAARYLIEHGVQSDPAAAVFAYNHSASYVQLVMSFAGTYASGGFTVSAVPADSVPGCLPGLDRLTGAHGVGPVPNNTVATAISYAEAQLGKPYLFGGTGPDAFDCSGLVMMAYRAAGVDIPRTSQQQWFWGPQVPASQAEPGDLVFFAGADGTPTAPGHVGLVIGHDVMIEAYATGFPLRVSPFGTPAAAPGDGNPVGFTRPWQHSGVVLAAG